MDEKLKQLRSSIDEIDAKLIELFNSRMEIANEVAQVKQKNNLAVKDTDREQIVVDRAVELASPHLKSETALLMRTLMSLSREYQHRLLFSTETVVLPPPRKPRTEDVTCAYQGVPGAWSEQATASLFPKAKTIATDHFEDVFLAVKNGEADYGVVAIENSKTGAIGETYDLLRKYGCYIVGRTWVPVHQCLAAIPGTKMSDIREVLSHPQGLRQCNGFLQTKNWDETACRNTAVAAQTVAEARDPKKAAIASRRAAELYGLEILQPDIMDESDNQTSFVVIALEPEYDSSSDLISVTFSTMHRSGALCEVLLSFMADNLNLMRIESRPTTMGQYRFFAEIQGNILDERVVSALRQSTAASEYFEVLGCYSCTEIKE